MSVTLIINFSLFQCLLTIYYKRWRELRGTLLIGCAFGGFIALIPFSNPNEVKVGHLNDISEIFSTLTSLIQITILGRGNSTKVKIKTLKYLTIVSELLILFGLIVVMMNLVDGVRFVLEHKKLEITTHLLFATHEYPFVGPEAEIALPWKDVQAVWNRLTIALCVTLALHEKLRTSDSRKTSRIASIGVSPAAVKQSAVAQAGAEPTSQRPAGGRMLRLRAQVKPLGLRVASRRPLAVLGHWP
ncbi:hypothetical protein Gpo141_00009846 [Globisporangium polare]